MPESCADRCTVLDDYIASRCRSELEHRTERLRIGLSPTFVPPIPRRTYRCPECGRDDWTSSLAAEACCNDIESD